MDEDFQKRLRDSLGEVRRQGLWRTMRPCDFGEDVLDLISNDYLGFAKHAALKQAKCEGVEKWGTSASASPFVSGYSPAHEALEAGLLEWTGMEAVLLFNSGYQANFSLLSVLPSKDDFILTDRQAHNSLLQGALKSSARLQRYRHDDIGHLKDWVSWHSQKGKTVFVVTESVFSMGGNLARLAEIVELKRSYPFVLIVDEAHALGWYGKEGQGLANEKGLKDEVDVIVGTFGKALGSSGAFIACHNPLLKDYLTQHAVALRYSTFFPPACAMATLKALELLKATSLLSQKGRKLARAVRQSLKLPENDSAIVSFLIGDAQATLKIQEELLKRKIAVGAMRPPTVPEGTSRLRISLKAHLELSQLEELFKLLNAEKKQ